MNWNSEQIREDAKRRKQELHSRLAQIPSDKKKLDDEVQTIKRELIGLDQILDGLEVMTSGPVPTPEPAGFTDKIRKLLSGTSIPLVPTQIRDALEQSGVAATSSKNLLINVHTVLERIDSELDKIKREDGKIAYKRKLPWSDPNIPNYMELALYGGMETASPDNQPRIPADYPAHKLTEGARFRREK